MVCAASASLECVKFFIENDILTDINKKFTHPQAGVMTYSGPQFSSFAMQEGFHYYLEYFYKMFFITNNINIKPSSCGLMIIGG